MSRRSALGLAAALLSLCAAGADAARRGADGITLDPIGTWRCVVYGHPALGDERLLLRFTPDGRTALAPADHDSVRPWVPMATWRTAGPAFTFADSRTGRQFEGDLRRDTLGGTWRTVTMVGGWWCNAVDGDDGIADGEAFRAAALMPPLIPERMATPTYPRQAIRAAKQGRVVTCFFVDAAGVITNPQIVELSDEVFRAPTLDALERSRYRSWQSGTASRPGCRSFIYRLDATTAAN